MRKRAHFPLVRRPLRPCLTLLPAGVTRPPVLLRTPVVSYTTFSLSLPTPLGVRGYLFSVALSGRLALLVEDRPAPGIIRRRALWSADFPRPRIAGPRPSDQPEAFR